MNWIECPSRSKLDDGERERKFEGFLANPIRRLQFHRKLARPIQRQGHSQIGKTVVSLGSSFISPLPGSALPAFRFRRERPFPARYPVPSWAPRDRNLRQSLAATPSGPLRQCLERQLVHPDHCSDPLERDQSCG